MKEICVNDIEPQFGLVAEGDKQVSLRINENLDETLLELGSPFSDSSLDCDKIDNPDLMQIDYPDELSEALPLSRAPEKDVLIISSDSDEDEFTGKVRGGVNLLRSKRQSFYFGDTSEEDEEEDLPNAADIAAIDDDIVCDDENFSHASLCQKIAEYDDQVLEHAVVQKHFVVRQESRKQTDFTNKPPQLTFENTFENHAVESEKSELKKRRDNRKRVRTWKIQNQRKKAMKRAKILFD